MNIYLLFIYITLHCTGYFVPLLTAIAWSDSKRQLAHNISLTICYALNECHFLPDVLIHGTTLEINK